MKLLPTEEQFMHSFIEPIFLENFHSARFLIRQLASLMLEAIFKER